MASWVFFAVLRIDWPLNKMLTAIFFLGDDLFLFFLPLFSTNSLPLHALGHLKKKYGDMLGFERRIGFGEGMLEYFGTVSHFSLR